jgi:hypothetical protein
MAVSCAFELMTLSAAASAASLVRDRFAMSLSRPSAVRILNMRGQVASGTTYARALRECP